MSNYTTRRNFLKMVGAGGAVLQLGSNALAKDSAKVIQGFEKAARDPEASKGWKPISDRKIRVGLVSLLTVHQKQYHYRYQSNCHHDDHADGRSGHTSSITSIIVYSFGGCDLTPRT